jgi:hypothetical protein
MHKPTTTPDRIRIALKERDPKNGAMVAFDRKHAGKVLINLLWEVIHKAGHSWPKEWPIPRKFATGGPAVTQGAPAPVAAGRRVLLAKMESTFGTDAPHPITLLHCPACGGGLEIPSQDTTQQCTKCWHTVKIQVVIKRSIVIAISD